MFTSSGVPQSRLVLHLTASVVVVVVCSVVVVALVVVCLVVVVAIVVVVVVVTSSVSHIPLPLLSMQHFFPTCMYGGLHSGTVVVGLVVVVVDFEPETALIMAFTIPFMKFTILSTIPVDVVLASTSVAASIAATASASIAFVVFIGRITIVGLYLNSLG